MGDDNLLLYDDMNDCVVAFVDILGFTNSVKSITDELSFIGVAETIHHLKVISSLAETDKTLYSNFNCTFVSDSIIISVPYRSEEDLAYMLLLLQRFQ